MILSIGHYQCMIDESDGLLTVWDLGTKLGTFINDVRISPTATLMPGDELTIGKNRFLARYDGPAKLASANRRRRIARVPVHPPRLIAGVNRWPRLDASPRRGKLALCIEPCYSGIPYDPTPSDSSGLHADCASAAPAAESTSDPLRSLPQPIPSAWLSPSRHPRWVVYAARNWRPRAASWPLPQPVQTFLKDQADMAARFAKMPAEKLIALVPRAKSQFVYGLGMNLDPLYKMRMRWAGWNRPFAVRDIKGNEYPNAAWPDHGDGVADPKTGERYYFIAQANAKIIQLLEQRMLPALADVYALSGSRPHARAAAILLDAIANVYPTNRRGPLDYPTAPSNYSWGGRLDRPGYQVARGLMNYVHAIDLLAPSGELERPSHFAKAAKHSRARDPQSAVGRRDLLPAFRPAGSALHNGQADYQRGRGFGGPAAWSPIVLRTAGRRPDQHLRDAGQQPRSERPLLRSLADVCLPHAEPLYRHGRRSGSHAAAGLARH